MSRSRPWLLAAVLGLLALGVDPALGRANVNDPVFSQGLQWGLGRIGAPDAWARSSGSGATIAIVDSGIDLQHQDLKGKLAGQVSCIGASDDPARCIGSAQDDNGHGTHVSGIAAAATDNGVGIAGVAPAANLLSVRVLANQCGPDGCTASGTSGDVAAGIRWAVDNGADVINLSLGGGAVQSAFGCRFCDAIEYAWSKGVISVVAAGNDAVLPAGFDNEPAVVVTATTRDDQRASYSSRNSALLRSARWPVAAPGGEAETKASDCATGGTPKGILSTYWVPGQSNAYACLAGTSMAAPHVSGALAVLLSTGLSPQQAIDRLLATATDLGTPGRDDVYGFGRVDLARAVGPEVVTTTSPGAAPPSTRRPGSTTTSPPATAPGGPTDTTAAPPPDVAAPPVVSTPETSSPAPFDDEPASGDDPPVWLILTATAALLASAAGTAGTAWRLR